MAQPHGPRHRSMQGSASESRSRSRAWANRNRHHCLEPRGRQAPTASSCIFLPRTHPPCLVVPLLRDEALQRRATGFQRCLGPCTEPQTRRCRRRQNRDRQRFTVWAWASPRRAAPAPAPAARWRSASWPSSPLRPRFGIPASAPETQGLKRLNSPPQLRHLRSFGLRQRCGRSVEGVLQALHQEVEWGDSPSLVQSLLFPPCAAMQPPGAAPRAPGRAPPQPREVLKPTHRQRLLHPLPGPGSRSPKNLRISGHPPQCRLHGSKRTQHKVPHT